LILIEGVEEDSGENTTDNNNIAEEEFKQAFKGLSKARDSSANGSEEGVEDTEDGVEDGLEDGGYGLDDGADEGGEGFDNARHDVRLVGRP